MPYTTITYQNLLSYRTIAKSIGIAIGVGWEQGLLLLKTDPWSTAIDQINAGLRTCYDLIHSGRRHEAIDWHYEGFWKWLIARARIDRAGLTGMKNQNHALSVCVGQSLACDMISSELRHS